MLRRWPAAADAAGRGQGTPERGRQYSFADSPDGALPRTVQRQGSQPLSRRPGDQDRNRDYHRRQPGAPDQVRLGELGLRRGTRIRSTAMWWSPDSRKLAFYRFDESPVPDYYLQLDQTKLQSAVDTEAYPKAGVANPSSICSIYDVGLEEDHEARRPRRQAVRQRRRSATTSIASAGRPTAASCCSTAPTAGRTCWSSSPPIPETGTLRVVLREEWPTGWIENSPTMVFLKDGQRFIWQSERNGWSNFYLYDLSGKLITPLTTHTTLRGGVAREGGRGRRRDVLHRARRRQSPEAAAAPRRPRRPAATSA